MTRPAWSCPSCWQIEPDLKQLFACAFVGLSDATRRQQPQAVERLQSDPFYHLAFFAPGSLPGEHYRSLFAGAVAHSPGSRLLHLCNLDRVAFALLSGHRPEFLNSLQQAEAAGRPILFQRSEAAWSTYPDNYRQVEGLVIQVGRAVIWRVLRFRLVAPGVTGRDFRPGVGAGAKPRFRPADRDGAAAARAAPAPGGHWLAWGRSLYSWDAPREN